MEFYLTRPAAIGNAYQEDRHFRRQMRKPVDSKIKGIVLQRIKKILLNSVGALLASMIVPKVAIDRIPSLRDELSEFPSKWAGKRRTVRRIAKRQSKRQSPN